MSTATLARAPGRRLPKGSLAAFVAAALVLAFGLPLAGPLAHAAGAERALEYGRSVARAVGHVNLTINATDAPAYSPSNLTNVPAGASVTLHFHNGGSLSHTFTLSTVANFVLDRGWSPAELNAWFKANGSLVNLSAAPGATVVGNFTLPANDTGVFFEFVSLDTYQFQAGMFGFLATSAGGPSVTLTEQATSSFSFVPNVLVVNATKYPVVVEVTVTNVGSLAHTWTLSALADVQPTPTNFTAYFSQHAPAANLQVPAASGGTVNGTFTIPGPGVYAFLCMVPGHFANGMNGSLFVGVPPPVIAPPPSTALVQTGVLAGAGVLLAVGVVVAFASNFVGRFPKSASPPGHH
ncbi:MAG TPA: plastocyanin/azurin family copper-binding protein [Thermoplasmata archaeon]|nr:plastocyanin/azurin family copper-binding protein [Thermoplasmata archaeon]